MRPFDQRGEGRAGFIITLAIVLVLIFVGMKVIPVRIDAYQFRDTLREEARYASVHKNDQEVRKRIMESAAEMQIPLDAKNLTIKRTRNSVVISARYEQPIDLKVTTYTYRFDAEQSAPVF
jgi:hypothetical protein